MTVTRGLTARQRAVVQCIHRHMAERGYPPTIREVGDEVGLASTSSVIHVLRTLENLGHVRRGIGGHAFPTSPDLGGEGS